MQNIMMSHGKWSHKESKTKSSINKLKQWRKVEAIKYKRFQVMNDKVSVTERVGYGIEQERVPATNEWQKSTAKILDLIPLKLQNFLGPSCCSHGAWPNPSSCYLLFMSPQRHFNIALLSPLIWVLLEPKEPEIVWISIIIFIVITLLKKIVYFYSGCLLFLLLLAIINRLWWTSLYIVCVSVSVGVCAVSFP